MSESRGKTILGPILNPRADGSVEFIRAGAIACDDNGIITFVGAERDFSSPIADLRNAVRSSGIILPPFLDAHTHIPQHPIRGRFLEGITEHPPEGRLLAGLNKNVFPAEARCVDEQYAERVAVDFAADALAQGVVGGAAYASIHMVATHLALQKLYPLWRVGLVLMEMNCPENLRLDIPQAERDMRYIAESFGERTIVTDRFAVAVGSDMRRMAAKLAERFSLRTQTHLNEQLREKAYVEKYLYPKAASYTEVYLRDGLLDCEGAGGAILAHCIHNTDAELAIIARQHAAVAHCPTSNTLLCSGVMPLDAIADRGIPYAICTDVGASPTMSMLAEMAQYLKVHASRSGRGRATPSEALYRATLAPAEILNLTEWVGAFEVGRRMSFIEVEPFGAIASSSADDAILTNLLGMTESDLHDSDRRLAIDALQKVELDAGPQLDLLERDVRATATRLENRILSVTLDGWQAWRRAPQSTRSAV
ncbi:MAG: guanine deaminase [Humisphaera sp.]|nr:guanine deaminase [Humisphaera sp.]